MTNEERAMLFSLADTANRTATNLNNALAELNAVRILLTGVCSAVASQPVFAAGFAAGLQAAIEVDTTFSLASPLPDELLDLRSQWIERLTPPPLKQLMQQP
jgi:hypothetical protein